MRFGFGILSRISAMENIFVVFFDLDVRYAESVSDSSTTATVYTLEREGKVTSLRRMMLFFGNKGKKRGGCRGRVGLDVLCNGLVLSTSNEAKEDKGEEHPDKRTLS